jgi:hypothetical protein
VKIVVETCAVHAAEAVRSDPSASSAPEPLVTDLDATHVRPQNGFGQAYRQFDTSWFLEVLVEG